MRCISWNLNGLDADRLDERTEAAVFEMLLGGPIEQVLLAGAPPPPPAGEKPERPAAVTHEGVACDKCNAQTIVGLRFRCLHCPSYNLCLPCLAEHGPAHDAEGEWPGREQAPHVFDILHEPEP